MKLASSSLSPPATQWTGDGYFSAPANRGGGGCDNHDTKPDGDGGNDEASRVGPPSSARRLSVPPFVSCNGSPHRGGPVLWKSCHGRRNCDSTQQAGISFLPAILVSNMLGHGVLRVLYSCSYPTHCADINNPKCALAFPNFKARWVYGYRHAKDMKSWSRHRAFFAGWKKSHIR